MVKAEPTALLPRPPYLVSISSLPCLPPWRPPQFTPQHSLHPSPPWPDTACLPLLTGHPLLGPQPPVVPFVLLLYASFVQSLRSVPAANHLARGTWGGGSLASSRCRPSGGG